jgi:hypothetical protein
MRRTRGRLHANNQEDPMATKALLAVLRRARADGRFYQLRQSEPPTALAGDGLTRDERLALQQRARGALLAPGAPIEWAAW